MKNKKGDFLTMDNIVLAALVLIVLVVLVIIFRGFLFQSSENLKNISSESLSQAKGDRCKTFFGFDRVCSQSQPTAGEGYTYEIVPGEFSDCKYTCYEKVRKE